MNTPVEARTSALDTAMATPAPAAMTPGARAPALSARVPAFAPGREREHVPLLYRVLRAVGGPVLRSLFDLSVEGREWLPTRGPFILAANHHNYLDSVVLGVAVPRRIAFLVMPSVYHATRLHPSFHRHVGSIPINLERPDPGAIKRALRVLGESGVIGIFPEGPFSLDGRLVKGQPGVALIALRAGVPVVPAAIRGTYEALAGRPWHIPRFHGLRARFGPPLFFGRFRRETPVPRSLREEVTRQIMGEIAHLLLDADPRAAARA